MPTEKGGVTGGYKPDLVVQRFDGSKFHDLIICEVKKPGRKDPYTKTLQQVSSASHQYVGDNASVYACVIKGKKGKREKGFLFPNVWHDGKRSLIQRPCCAISPWSTPRYTWGNGYEIGETQWECYGVSTGYT